ncbi:MAG: hypothetical protein CR996_00130 [Draconibacterium sp.]|nr:MAG: hypothetical protein CR996_00130 [Draconibacterium sp.]PIF05091.1 MAG: hypothetical protein CSA36_08525 [Draconibacterium sp.]
MKNFILIIGLALTINGCKTQKGQISKKAFKADKEAQRIEEVSQLVDSQAFEFEVRMVNPMSGSSFVPTTDYETKLKNDSLYSYLPFFGRAYSVEYGSMESPMIFDAAIQTVSTKKTKNGYLINIRVQNKNDNLEYNYHISATGSTTLSVSSTNRQIISYNGDIYPIKKEK